VVLSSVCFDALKWFVFLQEGPEGSVKAGDNFYF